jgi:HEAT repeat protein
MLDDDDADVRYYASKSLAQIGGAETVDSLLMAMQNELSAGGKIYIAEILASLYDKRTIEPLSQWVDDEDDGVRETVKWALQRLGAD